jgi:hypothetical protein
MLTTWVCEVVAKALGVARHSALKRERLRV